MKRYPDFEKIEAAYITASKVPLPRGYPFIVDKDNTYTCPDCGRQFSNYHISDSTNRIYDRRSAQARRHYNRDSCVAKHILIKEGYLRESPNMKPYLSNAVMYLLGLGKYQPTPIQIMRWKKIPIKFILHYHTMNLNTKRLAISNFQSDSSKRDIPIYMFEYQESYCDILLPSPKIRSSVRVYIEYRLQLMADIRLLEQMIYMPNIKRSEMLRPSEIDKPLTKGMKRYRDILDITEEHLPKKQRIGLLSEDGCVHTK